MLNALLGQAARVASVTGMGINCLRLNLHTLKSPLGFWRSFYYTKIAGICDICKTRVKSCGEAEDR